MNLTKSGNYNVDELIEDAKTCPISQAIIEKITGTVDETGNYIGGAFITDHREPAPTLFGSRDVEVKSNGSASSYSDGSDSDEYDHPHHKKVQQRVLARSTFRMARPKSTFRMARPKLVKVDEENLFEDFLTIPRMKDQNDAANAPPINLRRETVNSSADT